MQLGTNETLPELGLQFADYAVWQRAQFESEGASNEHLAYWLSKLQDDPVLLRLPYDRPRPLQPSYKGDSIIRFFSPDLTRRIKNLARAQGVSVYMLLLAAFKILLHRYSGENQITVGSPRRWTADKGTRGTDRLLHQHARVANGYR